MKLASVTLLLTVGSLWPAQVQAQQGHHDHVPPSLFAGTLYIGTVEHLSDRQAGLLEMEFGSEPKSLVLIGPLSEGIDRSCATCLRSAHWRDVAEHEIPNHLQSPGCAELTESLSGLGAGSCVWLHEEKLRGSAAEIQAWLGEQLTECLRRGATVCVQCQSTSSAADDQPAQAGTACSPVARMSLLPSIELSCTGKPDAATREASAPNEARLPTEAASHTDAASPRETASPIDAASPRALCDRASAMLTLPQGAWVRVRGRELFNLSTAAALTLHWPKTQQYPQGLVERLPPRSVCDLVAARRALAEREQPAFPADRPYEHRLAGGSLVIVGGGATPVEIWKKFVSLAGGESARILVLPTAVAEPESDAAEARIFERFGAEEVRVLPQIDRDQVSAPDFLKHFEWATGIWFGGGRQWRFVDAYWGTPAWDAIIGVARRGGAIGGSSAGATIQGDLLVRGHPLGNQIMIADGYRRGLGLLPGVAIDQHFRQRNRFDDLAGVVQRFPHILGIGIDEATALVVEAPDRCSVIGEGSVWLSYPQSDPREFVERTSGSSFSLGER